MRLDHFVIHVEPGTDSARKIAAQCAPLGFKFDLSDERNFETFAASYLYVGLEYIEFIELKKPDESGWIPQWVERFKQGQRGVYCVFLGTDDIDAVATGLRARGIDASAERSVFVDNNGVEVPFPWRQIYLPPIPGSNIEINFIQYDANASVLRQLFIPNSDENGLVGIRRAELSLNDLPLALGFLQQLFPDLKQEADVWRISLDNGTLEFKHGLKIELKLEVHSKNPRFPRGSFSDLNLAVST